MLCNSVRAVFVGVLFTLSSILDSLNYFGTFLASFVPRMFLLHYSRAQCIHTKGVCPSIFHWVSSFSTCHANSVRRLQRRTAAWGTWISSPVMTTRHAFVSWLASTPQYFLTFDKGLRLEQDEEGFLDTMHYGFQGFRKTSFMRDLCITNIVMSFASFFADPNHDFHDG